MKWRREGNETEKRMEGSMETVTKSNGGCNCLVGATVTKSLKEAVADPTWAQSTIATTLWYVEFLFHGMCVVTVRNAHRSVQSTIATMCSVQ